MHKSEKKMWQGKWGYAESIAITLGLLIIGFLLQLAVGSFDFYLLLYPVSAIVAGVLVVVSIVLGLRAKGSPFARWISGVPFSVTLLCALLLLAIIMGLTRQVSSVEVSTSFLGFDMMTSSWHFVLIYTMVILSLGTLVVRRLRRFNFRRDLSFMLLHAGLWLVLVCSGVGYADMERYIMHVTEGEVEWRVYGGDGNVKELPIAIELIDFDMDVYPPKIAMISRLSGEILPVGSPQFYQIDSDARAGNVNGWRIELLEYIHQAVRSSDSTYKEVPMPGSTPAVRVRATRASATFEGWVCGGNMAQLYMTLPVSEDECLVMTEPEPRSYTSEVKVYTESGDIKAEVIEVNNPLRIGHWTVYQYGYDNGAGRQSSYSSFELVYDKWLVPVYVGFIMMMLGSVFIVFNGKKRKERIGDVE